MMRSMYSAVSGLKTHQTKMDVIGNNIANVNTVAFKASNVNFSEIMSENLFTRAGSFYIDGAGNLAMTSTGYTVMGWQVDPITNDIKKDTVSALRIMQEKNLTSPPEATTEGTCAGVLDKNHEPEFL